MATRPFPGSYHASGWRALLSNVLDLIEDADTLLERKSYARARSLVILASEELARAVWLDRLASAVRLGPDSTVLVPAAFWREQKDHRAKLKEVEGYAVGLAYFWSGTDLSLEPIPTPRELGDRAAWLDREKMSGFYVEADAREVRSPSQLTRRTRSRVVRGEWRHRGRSWEGVGSSKGVSDAVGKLRDAALQVATQFSKKGGRPNGGHDLRQ